MNAIEHSRQKRKWRENSCKYYAVKKRLKAVLNLTPPSFEEPEPSRPVSETPPTFEEQEPSRPIIDSTPRPTRGLDLPPPRLASTPKSVRRSTMATLRAKLRETEIKLKKKNLDFSNLRRKMQRMKNGNKRREQQTVTVVKQKVQRRVPLQNNVRKQTETMVKRFLHNDDNSTMINGKSGEIRKKGQIYRKRALTNTMAHLHQKFLLENPNQKISFSQFCKLRPFWITTPKASQRETCAWKVHENFSFKIKRLHQLGIITTSSPTEVVASTVCDQSNKLCMYGQCMACKNKTLDPSTKQNIVNWEEWMTRTTPIRRKNKDGSVSDVEMRTTVLDKRCGSSEELVQLVCQDLPSFRIHIYHIGHQFAKMNTLKKNLANNETVIHIDYSENYSCKYSREVKDIHCSGCHQQISMHTGVKYLSRGRVECFCTISSCLRHDATATWAHLEPILKKMRRECPEVTVVHFLSDGPTSQYRNKTNFYLASTVPFMMGFQHEFQ